MKLRMTLGLGAACALAALGFVPGGYAGAHQKAVSVLPSQAVVDLNKAREKGAPSPMWFTQDFQLQNCTMQPFGSSTFYDLLKPGARTESLKPSENFRKTYLVLNRTKSMNLAGIGKFQASIVEEREYDKGVLRQISRNWYAICKQTGSVFSVGEFSQQLNADQTVHDTEGSWQAGVVNKQGEVALPAMQVPGTATLGSRYIFDGAPGVALGGARIVAQGLKTVNGMLNTVPTKYYKGEKNVPIPITKKIGEVSGCIQVEEISQNSETRKPELGDATNKVWCPRVGLVYDTSDGALVQSTRTTLK